MQERLSERSKPAVDGSGCIVWTGHRSNMGYGVMSVANRKQYVHRLSYEVAIGPLAAEDRADWSTR